MRLNVPATRRQFTQEQSMREAKMEAALFLWLFLEGTHGYFHLILMDTRVNCDSLWEGTTKDMNSRK